MDISPQVRETKTKINEWYCTKIKSSGQSLAFYSCVFSSCLSVVCWQIAPLACGHEEQAAPVVLLLLCPQGGWFWFLSGSWANEPSSSRLRFHSMLSKECRPPKIRVIWFNAFGCVVCVPGSCLVECAALAGCIGSLALSFFSLPLGNSFWNCLFSVERDLAQQDSAPHGLKTTNSCLDLSYWAPEVSL